MIIRDGKKWVLMFHDGQKKLGEFSSEADAMKREQEIMMLKKMYPKMKHD